MEKNVETKVGVFVVLGLVLLCISILLLGGNKVLFKSYYRLNVKFDDVQGLFTGSVVSLAGIPIGNIKDITFSQKENQLQVNLVIDESFKNRITQGTLASIKTQGALGDRYIYLTPGPSTSPSLPEDGEITAAEGGDLFSALSKNSDGLEKMMDTIREMHLLFKTINSDGKSQKIVDNISQTTEELLHASKGFKKLIVQLDSNIPENQEIKRSLTALAHVIEKIDEGQGTLGALVNDPSVYQRIRSLLGGKSRASTIKSLAREAIQQSEVSSEPSP